MRRMTIAGSAFWAPGVADAAALCRGERDPALTTPPVGILGTRAHARASLLTRMLCHVASAACSQAGAALEALPVVFGSAYGEIGRLAELVATPAGAPVSPLRFQASVHNTAGGQLSIACGNRLSSTAICAGDDTPIAVLWEAYGYLMEHGGSVLAAFADEAIPELLNGRAFAPLACGLVLTTGAGAGGARLVLPAEDARCQPVVDGSDGAERELSLAAYAHNPCRTGAALAWALERRQAGPVSFGGTTGFAGPTGRAFELELEFPA